MIKYIVVFFLCFSPVISLLAQEKSGHELRDSIYNKKGQIGLTLSGNVSGTITQGIDPSDHRLNYWIRLRSHYFLYKRLAIGAGLIYQDYWFSNPAERFDFDKEWNFEIFTRIYVLPRFHIGYSFLYGGVCRNRMYYEGINYNYHALTVGFEHRLNEKIYFDWEITNYIANKTNCLGGVGDYIRAFFGVTYYFDRGK